MHEDDEGYNQLTLWLGQLGVSCEIGIKPNYHDEKDGILK